MNPSSSIVLATGKINAAGDTVTISLSQPSGSPEVILVDWPHHVTIVQPHQFGQMAADVGRLFAIASTRYNQIRRHGRSPRLDL